MFVVVAFVFVCLIVGRYGKWGVGLCNVLKFFSVVAVIFKQVKHKFDLVFDLQGVRA